MKTPLLTLTYLVGIGELILAVFFWMTRGNNQVRRVICLIAFSLGVWVLLNALTAYQNPSKAIDFASSFIYLSVVVFVTAAVHFALLFPIPFVRLDRLHVFLLYLPASLSIYPIFFTRTIVRGYVLNPSISGYSLPGPLYGEFSTFLTVVLIITLWLLARQVMRTDGVLRRNATIVFWSLLVPIVGGIGYNLPHELRGTEYNSLVAPLLTSFWVILTSYIVLRK